LVIDFFLKQQLPISERQWQAEALRDQRARARPHCGAGARRAACGPPGGGQRGQRGQRGRGRGQGGPPGQATWAGSGGAGDSAAAFVRGGGAEPVRLWGGPERREGRHGAAWLACKWESFALSTVITCETMRAVRGGRGVASYTNYMLKHNQSF